MLARPYVVAAAGAAVAALAACGNPLGTTATLDVSTDTLTVYALSGTPALALSGLNTYTHTVVRVDASSNYDIAFDIDTNQHVVVYPVQLLYPQQLIGTSAAHTGLRTVTGSFESVTVAPTDGYSEDKPLILDPGAVVAVRAQPTICAGTLQTDLYSKLVVTSVNPANRTITFRFTVDPNCGYRSFQPGLPKS
jgi:hypothetical protein